MIFNGGIRLLNAKIKTDQYKGQDLSFNGQEKTMLKEKVVGVKSQDKISIDKKILIKTKETNIQR